MTIKYNTKAEALTEGLLLYGRIDICTKNGNRNEILELEKILENPYVSVIEDIQLSTLFDGSLEDCTIIDFDNGKNISVRIGSAKYRDGYDLWFISKDTNYAIRI